MALTSNEELTPGDLIRPLSLEAVEYFTGDSIPTAVRFERPGLCKFVRLGEVMILGSMISFGPKQGPEQKRAILFHRDLLSYLLEDPRLTERGQATAGDEPQLTHRIAKQPVPLNDAGVIGFIQTKENTYASYVYSDSQDFGSADQTGRQRTIQITQSTLGPTVEVSEM